MASECSTSFLVNFVLRSDAAITLGSVSAGLRPGFTSIYAWRVNFTYVTGEPHASEFRLNSADGLTGTFTPAMPLVGMTPTEMQNGILEGTVQIVLAPDAEATYNGTITIVQV